MKKVEVELALYDEWYDELKKEYDLTKKVLSNRFRFDETFEQFVERVVENILKSSDIKRTIDIYVGRKEPSEIDSCEEAEIDKTEDSAKIDNSV